ncbi:MAG TPA: PH domain-containing protein, partial [Acidimicrobiia bacterium]|nr:PH domain-containing protein [Acidimicrobiia bacterium]
RSLSGRITAIRILFCAPAVAIVGATAGATVAVACGLLTLVYALLIAWRVGVDATARGVVLRDYFRVRHIPWADVDHFELDETRPYGMHVVTVSGSRIKLEGLGPTLLFHDATMAKARTRVHALNTIRSEVLREDRS